MKSKVSRKLNDFVVKMRLKHAKRLRYRPTHNALYPVVNVSSVETNGVKVCKKIRLQTQEWHSCDAFEVDNEKSNANRILNKAKRKAHGAFERRSFKWYSKYIVWFLCTLDPLQGYYDKYVPLSPSWSGNMVERYLWCFWKARRIDDVEQRALCRFSRCTLIDQGDGITYLRVQIPNRVKGNAVYRLLASRKKIVVSTINTLLVLLLRRIMYFTVKTRCGLLTKTFCAHILIQIALPDTLCYL